MSMQELRQVSKVYSQDAAEVHALREVSLEVGPGTMVAVMDRVVHIRDGRITGRTVPAPGPGSLLGQDR